MIVEGKIAPFTSIGREEAQQAMVAIHHSLSGYLAGRERGGYFVQTLEDRWSDTFHVKHSIACNSATSGLLAAAFVTGLKSGDRFACSAMTMSATAAAPMFTGATPTFIDVEDETFSFGSSDLPYDQPVFVTNLFGHPGCLRRLRDWCELNKTVLIEDNAQSPFAKQNGSFAGTVGHIGVWSLNIHKPLQCGEGGMITTDDDDLAAALRAFINHGEHKGATIGLNLRMPEVCAAIALAQLKRGPAIIANRVSQAYAILDAIGGIPSIRQPLIRPGCTHSFYTIPFLIDTEGGSHRWAFCEALRAEGVPIVEGYVPPLYRMPAFQKWARPCPVAEDLHDRRLFYFENSAWDPTDAQIKQIGSAFQKAAEKAL